MAEEGVESMELAKQLNPNPPIWYSWMHGAALFGARRYDEAELVLQAAPAHTVISRLYLVATLARLGKLDEAKREVATAIDELPGLSIALLGQIETYRSAEDQEHLSDALRLAGLPDA